MIERYKRVVEKYLRAAIEQVKQQWGAYPNSYGNAQIDLIEKNSTIDVIAFIITAFGQKMWLLEYGKGESMASSSENPFLQEYLSSGLYNDAREKASRKVLGRPKGTYLDLDGNLHTSHGRFEGIPLQEIGIQKFIDNQIGLPLKPKYIIRNILFGENGKGIISEMKAELQQVTSDIVTEIFSKFPKRIVILE